MNSDTMETTTQPKSTSETELLYRSMTKGVQGAPEEFAYGMKWITARRALLKVFQDRIECGDWILPFDRFEEAVLFQTRSGLIPCFVLKIRTADNAFQFGISSNKFWKGELPFEVTREKGRLKLSLFSIILRGSLVAALIWHFFFRS